MKRIVIVGGGGFGRELYGYMKGDLSAGRLNGYALAGLLDDNPDCELAVKNQELTYLGALSSFVPQGNEVLVIAIGKASIRRNIFDQIKRRGISLFTYVHSSAQVMHEVTVGEGAVVCPNTIINAGAKLGDNVAVNVFCSVGHGASIGSHAVLSPYCALSGDSKLGRCGFMGTRATLFPGVVMGDGCIVDAHSAVRQSVGDNKIVSVRGEYLVLDNRFNR
jgi:sugar O-acyltransferase (sialic acid O-acetyltransferase NeuD family)